MRAEPNFGLQKSSCQKPTRLASGLGLLMNSRNRNNGKSGLLIVLASVCVLLNWDIASVGIKYLYYAA
jgi:hypothetical protein